MTRQAPASAFKGQRGGRRANIGGAPRPGTALSRAYHALRRGEVIHGDACDIRQLVIFYGMDVIGRQGPGGFIRLRGEWDGPIFMTVEQTAAQEQARDMELVA